MLPCVGEAGGRAGGTLECTRLCIPSFRGVLGVVSDLGWEHLCSWGMAAVRIRREMSFSLRGVHGQESLRRGMSTSLGNA